MKCASKILLFVCTFLPVSAIAQVQTGTPPFGTFAGGPDTVDVANLNATITIPIVNKIGRGMNFAYNLTYDSSIWTPVSSGSTMSWQPAPSWGWSPGTPQIGFLREATTIIQQQCMSGRRIGKIQFVEHFWTYYDGNGPHSFPGWSGSYSNGCTGQNQTYNLTNDEATDGSGYKLTADDATFVSLYGPNGASLDPPLGDTSASSEDRNGNVISETAGGVFTDTLGTAALTIGGAIPTVTYSYTAPSGATAKYTVNYTNYTVATNFGVSGISEFAATAEYLVSSIVLPDGSQYTFTYEPTPSTPSSGACTPLGGTYPANCVTARIASVALPTGGAISYAYSGGNNGILGDGSTATLTRTTPDTGSNHWTYARSESGSVWTTTVTDPQGNQTVDTFQSGLYQTERQVYSGTSTLLETVFTCYNGATPNCNSASISQPITSVANYVQWPSGMESKTLANYNSNGLPTENDEYDYGNGSPGNLLRKTLTTYASLGNIVGEPASVTIESGSGSIVAETTYQYDQTAVTATSGTPQHGSVSGSRGNVTTITYLTQGSSTLSKKLTYFDTGNVDVATDVNGAQTTFTYGNCGNSFATSVAEPMSMSKSMAWNCTGGVETSATDENGNTTSTAYTDPYFWRPASSTDQENNTTYYTYANPNSTESSLVFNNNGSTTDVLTTLDGLGRSHLTQTKQSPSSTSYDSVETDYDSMGRVDRITVPYSATSGVANSSAPATATTYDALSRTSTTTDGGGGTVSLFYSANDVLRTAGPAASGENTKRRQFEYNGIRQLTSVCEITNLSGSGTCGQTTSAAGYWTKYGYDVLGDLLTVTQDAQSSTAQSRGYTYDGLKRTTSETNPETGTTYYFYDADPGTKGGANCPGTYNGDLVKHVDAAGNVTCYTYDALHRKTSVTYPYGTNSSNTPSKYFVYDSATVDSVPMANAKMRLAEVYTCTSACTSKLTDEGFSYTVRGEVQDVYESTPHSGGYYHVDETYWANGAPEQLSGLAGLPTITYGPDGEGRTNTVSASSGQNPVSGTTYNVASKVTQMSLGSGDNDAFQYDPHTFRMTQYQFNINGQSDTGALTWNANGSLASLDITDAFNSTNTQNCAYTHDDLARIASANCGSVWSQTFTYDAFGNLTKTGSEQFQPGYNWQTNYMSSGATYDSDGEVLTDSLHSYAWDVEGRPTTIDGIAATYDALGRMAEQNNSGSYTQIVWSPTGDKLGYMNGQTFEQANVPLPEAMVVAYNSSGILNYHHVDWLGSYRLASTPTRTVSWDGAYAPFGEPYAQSGGTVDLSFTGQNQDTATNLYDFPAREYGIQGRWPSPDPVGIGAAHAANPQSWNRYAYVANDPVDGVDPSGTDFGEDGPQCDINPFDASCSCDPIFGCVWGGGGDGSERRRCGDSMCEGGGELLPPPPQPTENEEDTVCNCRRVFAVIVGDSVLYTCVCNPHFPDCSGTTLGTISWTALKTKYQELYGSTPARPPFQERSDAIELEIQEDLGFILFTSCTYTLTDILWVSREY